MNAPLPRRGKHLIARARWPLAAPQWFARGFARAWSGGLNRVLDRIDAGLETGSIEATLPDGSTRLLGGRRAGFAAVVRLNSARSLVRLATSGSVGWFEAWQAGEWDSPDPVELFALFMANAVRLGDAARATGPWRWFARGFHRLHRNTRAGSLRNVHAHYDLGNDFYSAWLGSTMSYSSALFEHDPQAHPAPTPTRADALDFAQLRKLHAIAERLRVGKGDTVLEIGCGWGGLAMLLAGRGARVDAISLSDEQLGFCRSRALHHTRNAPPEYRKQDYRDVAGSYDAIASIEMIEALGREYWPQFLDCLARNLKPGGRAALQFISLAEPIFADYARSADFLQTYIFPGGMLIRTAEFRALAEARGLSWHDQVDFGAHYAETLRSWRANFDRAVDEGRLPAGFDHTFVRLWRYYLMYCEGGFRGGGIDVSQVTLVKRG